MADCLHCGIELHRGDSIALGYGPRCAELLGLVQGDGLPQRSDGARLSQRALRLLWGASGPTKRVIRYDGSTAWVDRATGELVAAGAGERSEAPAGASAA